MPQIKLKLANIKYKFDVIIQVEDGTATILDTFENMEAAFKYKKHLLLGKGTEGSEIVIQKCNNSIET